MQSKLILLLCLFAVYGFGQVTLSKNIFLQTNERYYLDLTDYYSKTASAIAFPEPSQQLYEINQPLINLGNIQTLQTPPDFIAASFIEGNDVKYLATITSSMVHSTQYNVILSLIVLQMNDSGVLTATTLATATINTISKAVMQVYGSMFDKYGGFLTTDSEISFKFQYDGTKTLVFQQITVVLKKNTSFLGPKEGVYVIQLTFGALLLYKYQLDTLQLKQIDRYNLGQMTFSSSNQFVDQGRYFMLYQQSTNSFLCADIEFSTEKIAMTQVQIPGFGQTNYLQRVGQYIMIVSDSYVIQLKPQNFFQTRQLILSQVTKLPFPLDNPVFIDANQILTIDYSQKIQKLQLVNIAKKSIVYFNTPNPSSVVIPFFILSNQFILYQYDNTGQLTQITNYQIQNPSMIVYGQQQSFVVQITTSPQNIIYKLTFVVLIADTPQTVLNTQNVQLGNTVESGQNQLQIYPIENYITGSNLQLNLTVQTPNTVVSVQNATVNQTIILQPTSNANYTNDLKQYQCDGYFNTLIQQQNNTIYQLSLIFARPATQPGQIAQKLDSPVDIIDNNCNFNLLSDKTSETKRIYLPVVAKLKPILNYIEFQCDTTTVTNFSFSGDTSNSVLFVMCGSNLFQYKYQASEQSNSPATIISTTQIQFVASAYTNLICLRGTLIISNTVSIAGYNYLTNGLFSGVLTIPTIGAQSQTVTFFSSTFLVTSTDASSNVIINQYSYNNFIPQNPYLPLRSFYKSNINPTAKAYFIRNDQEYALYPSKIQSEFYLFRINQFNTYSQNQLYTTISYPADVPSIPLLSQNYICSYGSLIQCIQILNQSSLVLKVTSDPSTFQSQVYFPLSLTLKATASLTQNYQIALQRSVQINDGIVNQQASGIQNLRTAVQDTNWTGSQSFQFDDSSVFNANLLGWDMYEGGSATNKLQKSVIDTQNSFSILYNTIAILTSSSITINNNLVIKGTFNNNCVLLDDKASYTMTNSAITQFNLYLLCPQQVTVYEVNLTTNTATQSSQASFSVSELIINYTRLVTLQGQQFLFNIDGSDQAQMSITGDTATFEKQNISSFNQYTYYYIYTSGVYLVFVPSGQIIVYQISNNQQLQVSNIYDLLAPYNFVVDQAQNLGTIEQYSDTQFRISFRDYIALFDVTFAYSSGSNLKISSALQFSVVSGAGTYQGGLKGDNYVLLIFSNLNFFATAYYYNTSSAPNFLYLIQSSINLTSLTTVCKSISLSSNQQPIVSTGLQTVQISITNTVAFSIVSTSQPQQIVHFRPINSFQPYNEVELNIQRGSSIPSSFSSKLVLSVVTILITLIFLV